jgi:hypothetical protein
VDVNAPPLLSVADTVAAVVAERARLIAKMEGGLYGSLSSLSLDLGGTKTSKGSKSSRGGGSVGEPKGLSMVEMVALCTHTLYPHTHTQRTRSSPPDHVHAALSPHFCAPPQLSLL